MTRNDGSMPRVIVYVPAFLTASMTFVYRQLRGVEPWFETGVLTTERQHADRFPFERISVVPIGKADRVVRGLRSRVSDSVENVGPLQRRAFARVLTARRPALVHAHFGPSGLDVLPVVRALDIPLVVTFHGYDVSSLVRKSGYVRRLRGLFDRAHSITISRRMAGQLEELGARPESIHTHYIGVPLEAFEFVQRRPVAEKLRSGETVRLLQVSNFVEKKGHRYTVEAFARFAAQVPGVRLTLAGDGPLRADVERQVRTAGVADRVEFAGKVDEREVARLMAESDVFVHHSVTASDGDQEGIPTALMEAMARGLVVVSTFHAGIGELVENGAEGHLVEERDVEAYTRVLLGLRDADPDLPRRARAKIERSFDMEKQNRSLAAIYREVMEAAR